MGRKGRGMSAAHDAGKGDDSRVRNYRKYSERNDEIYWPGREAKRDAEQRARMDKRLKGKKCERCVESDWPPHLD